MKLNQLYYKWVGPNDPTKMTELMAIVNLGKSTRSFDFLTLFLKLMQMSFAIVTW